MVKTTLKSQEITTPQLPVWVDNKWPKVTPELEKTMTKTTLWSQPVIQQTAQEVSATSENRANQQQQEADKLMALSSNIDRALWLDQPKQVVTDTSWTWEFKPFDPNNKTVWQWWNTFWKNDTQSSQELITQTPELTTTVTKETPKPTGITKDTQWSDVQNKDLNSLEQLIEARYGTVATQKDGKLFANVWGKNFEWSLQNGQPVKTEVQQEPITSGLLNKYISASSDEIYNGLINGDIPPSIENQIAWNPNYAIAKEKQRKKLSADNTNRMVGTIYNAVAGKTTETEDKYQSTSDKIVENLKAKWKTDEEISDYASFLWEDKELTRYTEELNAKNKQYKQIMDVAQDNAKNIMKTNPWITEASALLLAARQNEPLEQQLESLSYEIGNLQANINYREKINEVAYKDKQQIAQEKRQMENSLELYKQQQILQSGDLTSTDPYIQQRGIENAVNQLYTQYPIPWMESPALKIQKVKDLIAQWMTPQQAIQQIESEIRGSQRYKDYLASEKAKITPTKAPQIEEIWWVKYQYNETTNAYEPLNITSITRDQAIQNYGSTPAVRNFNPWNIMDTGFGWEKVAWERFTRFESPEAGFNALVAKIQNIQAGNSRVYSPDMTITEYISKYAPASDNNNVWTYSGSIAKDLWVSVNTKIWQLDPIKLASAHAKHEDWNSYKMLLDLGIINKDWTLAWGTWTTNMYDNLDKTQQSRIDKYVLDFENQPEVKEYSVIKSQLEWAREYAKIDGSNTDDQALIYTFAKVMDPNSVVRESEYETVQEYSQNLLWRYAGKIWRIYSTDWFLTQDAKEKMLKTLETKLKASESVMSNIRKATSKQLNQITGQQNWEEFLKDFVWQPTTTGTTSSKTDDYLKSLWY